MFDQHMKKLQWFNIGLVVSKIDCWCSGWKKLLRRQLMKKMSEAQNIIFTIRSNLPCHTAQGCAMSLSLSLRRTTLKVVNCMCFSLVMSGSSLRFWSIFHLLPGYFWSADWFILTGYFSLCYKSNFVWEM